jgi:hypothetical protein
MGKVKFNATKLGDRLKFQAVCTNDRFAGPLEDNESDAEGDAARHKAKPGNQNHIVNIVTIQQKVRTFNQ